MKPYDEIDEILYRDLEQLDHKMMECLEHENQEEYEFSPEFNEKMWLLEDQIQSESLRVHEDDGHPLRLLSSKRLCVVALVSVMTLLFTLTAVAAGDKIIRYSQYHDSLQGADVYHYRMENNGEEPNVVRVYPEYIPDSYKETACRYDDGFHRLDITYNDEAGRTIRYSMWQMTDGVSVGMVFDAEYDSGETLEINGLDWFCTYKEDGYRMARVLKDDLYFLLNCPDTLPQEDFLKLLEGIVPPERPDVPAVERRAEE